jgi:hypothetical protein
VKCRVTEGPIKSTAWRDRAEEYRTFYEGARSTDARRAYLAIAKNCDEIAARLEKLEAAEAERAQRVRDGDAT